MSTHTLDIFSILFFFFSPLLLIGSSFLKLKLNSWEFQTIILWDASVNLRYHSRVSLCNPIKTLLGYNVGFPGPTDYCTIATFLILVKHIGDGDGESIFWFPFWPLASLRERSVIYRVWWTCLERGQTRPPNPIWGQSDWQVVYGVPWWARDIL